MLSQQTPSTQWAEPHSTSAEQLVPCDFMHAAPVPVALQTLPAAHAATMRPIDALRFE